jgi:hypothetical protein
VSRKSIGTSIPGSVPHAVTTRFAAGGDGRLVEITGKVSRGPAVVIGRPVVLSLPAEAAAELALAVLYALPFDLYTRHPDLANRVDKLARIVHQP